MNKFKSLTSLGTAVLVAALIGLSAFHAGSASGQATVQTNTPPDNTVQLGTGPGLAISGVLTNSQGWTTGYILPIPNASQISVQIVDSNNVSGNQTNVVTVDKSNDARNWVTGAYVFTCVGQGSLTVATSMTNVSIGGDAYWRLTPSNSMATANATNVFKLNVSFKTGL